MFSIVIYPNPILEKVAQKVAIPIDIETQDLIKKMHKKVEGIGVGLAAPQVGESLQLCIIRLDKDMALKKDKELDFVMINPIITFYSELESQMIEGCLSFPKQYYQIDRPANIIVEYDTITNYLEFISKNGTKPIVKKKRLKASGWLARVIQHEVDHLAGKLFINKGGKKIDEDKIDGSQIID
jgi:peptide deformylase